MYLHENSQHELLYLQLAKKSSILFHYKSMPVRKMNEKIKNFSVEIQCFMPTYSQFHLLYMARPTVRKTNESLAVGKCSRLHMNVSAGILRVHIRLKNRL